LKSVPLLALATLLLLFSARAASQTLADCPNGTAARGQRYLAVVSDLHLGLGGRPDGTWHPLEDFRGNGALAGFLQRLTQCAKGRADLLIAGDLLELWQPPDGGECKDSRGCTVEELAAIAGAVVRSHRDTLEVLRAFADAEDNRVHVIPGNHDAGLLLAEIWTLFESALGAQPGRVRKVDSGVWISEDGVILVEHGHQIGADANRYATWPPQIARASNGSRYVPRPWGENFVQSLFNEQEARYPVIDNLSPESAGIRYRMADRGLWGSTADLARFLSFNLFETSLQQKAQGLGGAEDDARHDWDVARGRKMGYRLFADALAANDPFRAALLAEDGTSAELRRELDEAARDAKRTTDQEVQLLCDQIAIRNNEGSSRCEPPVLGAGAEKLLIPRSRVLRDHLRARLAEQGAAKARVFIYGHTHMLEEAYPLDLSDLVRVTVLNSGAFQRIVGEEGFLARTRKRGIAPAAALRALQVSDLPPCYSVVLVPYEDEAPRPRTVNWYAPEGEQGAFVEPRDERCK
jgi:UDP-2,3-diacylglucosamine pyrophosphatase LpxH